MSRAGWHGTGASIAAGTRPWSVADRGPGYHTDHPGPDPVELQAMRITDAFRETFPALARAYPDRVTEFQLEVERALRGLPPRRLRERRGRKSS